MAINPMIALSGQAPKVDVGTPISRLMNIHSQSLQNDALKQQMAAQEEINPLLRQLREGQVTQQGLSNEATQFQLDQSKGMELYNHATALRKMTPEQRTQAVGALAPRLMELGIPEAEIANGLDDNELDFAINALSRFAPKPSTAAIAEFEAKAAAAGLQQGTEEYKKAAMIDLGMVPRASTSADERIATDERLTQQVADSKATIASSESKAKETGRLEAQAELKPEVEAAVAGAVERVKNEAEREDQAKSNETSLAVYDQAMSGLVGALSGTDTGPGMNWVSLTANQQIADGAVAAMAPVLKQLFRGAGEGTFTDRDQEMLLAMVPTRKDHPEAIRAKIQNIDAIVRMKLGGAPKQEGPNIDDLVNKYAD